MPLINFTKDQLSIIQTSLEASIKYADSEYISKVDNILEKIGNLDDLFYDHHFVGITEEETEPVNYYQGA